MTRKAVVLLSGGIDSTTAMAVAGGEGFELYAISFRYGQRHLRELDMAKLTAQRFAARAHIVIDFDLRAIGGSALTGEVDVPKGRPLEEISGDIPVTYVPGRNTIFLSFAVAWAEVIGARDIFIGANDIDYSGYPDCRPEFIEAFERAANLGTRSGVGGSPFTIHAPLIGMTKAEIIRTGLSLEVDYSITHSCYDPTPDHRACGRCDSCLLRLKGFKEAGLDDPIPYSLAPPL